MKHNVYDFDGTIYDGDSTLDFYRFCARRHFKCVSVLPGTFFCFLQYKCGSCGKTRLKEVFYGFLRHLPNVEDEVALFWKEHAGKIKPWYLAQRKECDIIISASPVFLLKPICEKIGVSCLIASQVDPKTGAAMGENCRGAEKVRRLFDEIPDCSISEFYSDSLADAPLAALAEQSFLVKKNEILEWKCDKGE